MARACPYLPLTPRPPTPSRHLSGIYHFVLEKLQMPHGGAGRSYIYENPTVGLKNTVQTPYTATTPKLHFPANKLQRPYLWKIICNNLIKLAREVPKSNSY